LSNRRRPLGIYDPSLNWDDFGGSLAQGRLKAVGATSNVSQGEADLAVSGAIRFPWFALQVRTRHEIGVASHLDSIGFEWFLPLYKCRKRWSDRIKESEVPLFPGYLFCRLNLQDRLPILKTPGVLQIVGFNRQAVPVDEVEISALQRLVASGVPNHPWPYLEVGEMVRIESGPLRGLEGKVVEFRGNHRLVLSVKLLQRSVAVEMDSAFVEAVRSSRKTGLEKAYAQTRPAQAGVF
jgi:transcription antitermination factor NusG